MTWFDLLAIGVILLSAGFAAMRGAAREAATLISIVAAIAAAVYGAAYFAGGASFVTAAGVAFALFFAAFLPLVFLFGMFLKQPTKPRARLIDQACGGVFGAARGLALVGLGYLAYAYVYAEERHAPAVANAATLPLAKAVAGAFETLVPESVQLEEDDEDAGEAGADAALDRARFGYAQAERDSLRELIATVTTSPASVASANAADKEIAQ